MLTGDNGILQRAGEAKEMNDRAQIAEQARLDILAQIAENKGKNPTEAKIKEILEIYFNSDTIPDDLSNLNQEMTTKNGGFTVKLSEVLNGVTVKQDEVTETPIKKSTAIADSYIGYYADIDNDGNVDGIIYADMIVGNTKSGKWNNNDDSVYNVTKIEDTKSVKDYVVSSKTYDGQTTPGMYKANDEFGVKEVLVPAENSKGTKDRFYLMALEDVTADWFNEVSEDGFTASINNIFYWYKSALGKLDDIIASSSIDFGEGKSNTIKEINRWNANGYGNQNTWDLWNIIQNKIEKKEEGGKVVDCKWFVPSKSEWSSIGEELGITGDNHLRYGLADFYWSSSQHAKENVYRANMLFGYMDYCRTGEDLFGVLIGNCYVRLSTTF